MAQLKQVQWISELSSCKTPSVKRAVSKLELAQSIIGEWLMIVMENVKPQTGSQHGSTPEGGAQDIPGHGVQEGILEVIALLGELENDRMETQEKYRRERRRGELLQHKIDNLQLQHLQELPALVQREHEACQMDLSELHWHVTYTRRLEARAQARFSVADRNNVQLRDGIDFVKQHVPLVQEKLILEVEAMDIVRKAQGEADQELMMARQIQTKTEVKSQETVTKANTERGHIKMELGSVRDDLRSISHQLSKSQTSFKAYVDHMSDIHLRLTGNERSMHDMTKRNDIARISEESQAVKVRSVHARVTEAEFDHRQLEAESQRQEQLLNINKDKHTFALTSLEQQRKALDVKLWKLARRKQEQEVDIQDCEEKIAKCDQQKAADVKSLNRMSQDLERTAILVEQTEAQHQHHFGVNLRLKEQLQSEQYQTFQAEGKLKKAGESLRKQTQEETRTKTVLAAQISSDLAETEKTKLDLDKRKEKAKTVTDELSRALSVVAQKVAALQASKAETQQQKESLECKIGETEKQHSDSDERFRQKLGSIQPQLQAVKSKLGLLTGQLQTMDDQSKRMTRGVEEMDAAQTMMDRVAAALERDIQVLVTDKHELDLQIESARKIGADLLDRFNSTLERLSASHSSHERLQKERQTFLQVQEADKAELIYRNKELASRYRRLQQTYISQKELMLRSYEERVRVEAAITDMKQLKSFQTKLHSALMEYFKYRGLHSQAELSKLKEESSRNGVRVSELQVNMERALEDIALFLSSQKGDKISQQRDGKTAKEGQGAQTSVLSEGSLKPEGMLKSEGKRLSLTA